MYGHQQITFSVSKPYQLFQFWVKKKKAKKYFCWLIHSSTVILLKNAIADLHIVAIMAVRLWFWSLNKIPSSLSWIRKVKRISCNIPCSPHVGKKKPQVSDWYTLLRLFSAFHTVCQVSWSIVKKKKLCRRDVRSNETQQFTALYHWLQWS